MKTLFKIHPFFYIFVLICIFTGYFKNIIIITFIILFHELGHILTSLYYKWKIEKVLLLPFGCITIYNEKINRPIKEEFLITIMGPIFQLFLFLNTSELLRFYNLNLLIFNLIPILPLDGSKIINLLLNKFFSYKTSHIISIIISIILIVFMFLIRFNLVIYLTIIFLLIRVYKEYKLHNYLFNKFLFERYLYTFNFKKRAIINNSKKMKRDYKHIFKSRDKYITEKEYLTKCFK